MAPEHTEGGARAKVARLAAWRAQGGPDALQRWLAWECACVLALNRLLEHSRCSAAACCISRLGNGELWVVLLVALALTPGDQGLRCALQLTAASLLGLGIYKLVKTCAARPRPYVRMPELRLSAAPLDEHSFPSGHVLHAVSFSVIVTAHFPILGLLLVPFAMLTALVRVVLGLHYPSDVLAGIGIGAAVALLSFKIFPVL